MIVANRTELSDELQTVARDQPIAVKELKDNGFRFWNVLDTRYARVLNPRTSVAFGIQKSQDLHIWDPGCVYGSWNGLVFQLWQEM